jgi:hypothetical protein
MSVRMLDATASDFLAMDAPGLAASIRGAEGRTLSAEVIATTAPPVGGISLGELAAAFGADLITLDAYDALKPQIMGVTSHILEDKQPLAAYKRLLGRPIAVNLVVAPDNLTLNGRQAIPEHFELIHDQGADLVFLYARPGQGGTIERQQAAARQAGEVFGDEVLLIGVPSFSLPPPRTPQQIITYQQHIDTLMEAGCAGIGMPMPGSKQGWLFDTARQLIDHVHSADGLAWVFVTGSVEGAPPETMQQMAVAAKQLGADAIRLDEAGLSGMPLPENIYQFSLALRGKRHTYRRMASSIRR